MNTITANDRVEVASRHHRLNGLTGTVIDVTGNTAKVRFFVYPGDYVVEPVAVVALRAAGAFTDPCECHTTSGAGICYPCQIRRRQ